MQKYDTGTKMTINGLSIASKWWSSRLCALLVRGNSDKTHELAMIPSTWEPNGIIWASNKQGYLQYIMISTFPVKSVLCCIQFSKIIMIVSLRLTCIVGNLLAKRFKTTIMQNMCDVEYCFQNQKHPNNFCSGNTDEYSFHFLDLFQANQSRYYPIFRIKLVSEKQIIKLLDKPSLTYRSSQ